MRDFSHDIDREVDQVMGAFFLVRSELFFKCDGFDERFFVYYEEVDFSKRIADLGYKSMFLSRSHAFHVGGGASRNVKAERLFYSIRSKFLYALKHFNKPSIIIVIVSIFIVEPITRTIFNLIQINIKGIKETFRAYTMLLSWLSKYISG